MYISEEVVSLTTDGSGDATGYTSEIPWGRIYDIQYQLGAAPMTTPTVAITEERTGRSIWSEAALAGATIRAPRQLTHQEDGTALTPRGLVSVVSSRVKVVVSSAGATKDGTFRVRIAH
jgi:hypothetical protein